MDISVDVHLDPDCKIVVNNYSNDGSIQFRSKIYPSVTIFPCEGGRVFLARALREAANALERQESDL